MAPDATTTTLGEAVLAAQRMLSGAGIEDAGRDARLLAAAAAAVTTADIIAHPERPLSADVQAKLAAMLARRGAHEPVSRILGEREFYGRRFALSPATLDPRPDTETLIDVALSIAEREGWREKPIRILDIGTGTGCLLLTLLAELPLATGLGTDISRDALVMATSNAVALGVSSRAAFEMHDVLDGVEGRFDLVVSNPPYIPTGDIVGLDPDVRDFDPRAALDGGVDGLNIYRRIASGLDQAATGWVLLEVGAGQADAVALVLHQAFVKTRQAQVTKHWDLGGHVRCVALPLQL
jgi:release factor glutamine methyltransferase